MSARKVNFLTKIFLNYYDLHLKLKTGFLDYQTIVQEKQSTAGSF